MPGNVAPVADEREALLAYLAQQRYVLKLTAYGLTDERARMQPLSTTTLSVAGLIKHVAATETFWIDVAQGHFRSQEDSYDDNFRVGPEETLATLIAQYDGVARNTEKVLAGIADLGQAVPVPRDVPWFPDDVDAWSVRWVLLHVIEETARHAGHADIVREAVDGATAFPLMAAAEGWPPNEYLQPWTPPAS
jgi:uncharacterized damage-inducible protein DinB